MNIIKNQKNKCQELQNKNDKWNGQDQESSRYDEHIYDLYYASLDSDWQLF